jgi:hypothetical protein
VAGVCPAGAERQVVTLRHLPWAPASCSWTGNLAFTRPCDALGRCGPGRQSKTRGKPVHEQDHPCGG